MPSASRRKTKKAKKVKTWTKPPNHHSSSAVQLQGSANHSKKMDGSHNGTLQDTQKVEIESLSEEKKEVVVEVDAVDEDKSLSEGDLAITDEDATQSEENKELIESEKVEEIEKVSELFAEFLGPDAIKDAQVDNIMVSDVVELKLKEENDEVKETELPPSEDNNEFSSVSGNEGLRETEVVETIVKDMAVAEEEKNVLSSVVTDSLLKEGEESNEVFENSSMPLTDVASKESLETIAPKSNETHIIEKSLEASMDEKVEEKSNVQGESSYKSAESFQPSPNVAHVESTVQDKTEMAPTSTENPTIVPETQRQHTSWKSCCGLFEIMMGGG